MLPGEPEQFFVSSKPVDPQPLQCLGLSKPALPVRVRRGVQEFAGTAVMMFSMQLLEKRGAGLSPDNLVLWNTLKALYSAFIIAVLILGLGGPTGML